MVGYGDEWTYISLSQATLCFVDLQGVTMGLEVAVDKLEKLVV